MITLSQGAAAATVILNTAVAVAQNSVQAAENALGLHNYSLGNYTTLFGNSTGKALLILKKSHKCRCNFPNVLTLSIVSPSCTPSTMVVELSSRPSAWPSASASYGSGSEALLLIRYSLVV